MSKITDYSAASRFDNADVLLKDGTNGTKKILASDAAVEFAGMLSAINHRNVYNTANLEGLLNDFKHTMETHAIFDSTFNG